MSRGISWKSPEKLSKAFHFESESKPYIYNSPINKKLDLGEQ